MTSNLRLAFLLVAFLPVLAIGGMVRGIVSGYVFDRSVSGIRAVVGIPGAATQADPLGVDVKLVHAAISPRGEYALAVETVTNDLIEIMGLSSSPSIRVIAPGPRSIDMLRLGPNGTAALVYRKSANTLQFISGLPNAPWVWNEVDIAGAAGTTGEAVVTAVAVSDDARLALAAVNGSGQGGLFVVERGGNTRQILSGRRFSAVAFLPGSHDAVVADDAENTVTLIHDAGAAAAPVLLARKEQGVSSPIGVAASADRRRVFVANAQPGTVLEIEVNSQLYAAYACACRPTELTPVSGNALFRLTESSAPLWLFDGNALKPRVVFVPPGAPSRREGQ